MKKLIVVTALLLASVIPARAETVRTCSTVYGGGEVCGETQMPQSSTKSSRLVPMTLK